MIDGLGLYWFDVIAVAVIALSALMAFARGLIREVFSIIAFIGAAIAAIYLAGWGSGVAESLLGLKGILATLAAGLFIFLVVFIAITVLTSVMAKTVHESAEIGALDRVGGAIYGVLRGMLVVSLFVLLMLQSERPNADPPQRVPQEVSGAATYRPFYMIATALQNLPGLEQLRERVQNNYTRDAETADSPQPPSKTVPLPPQDPAPGEKTDAEPKAGQQKK